VKIWSRRVFALVLTSIGVTQLALAKTNTTTSLSSSANPSTYNSSVTFTATVSPSAATGTVTFKDGSTTLGTGTLSSGKATYKTSSLAVGSHSITAVYGGNSNYNGSTSSVLTQTVNKATTTTTVASSKNPSTFGGSVTFTATISPSTATGTVTFKDGSTTLGTGTVSSGKATYTTSALAAGSHSITAAYGGDSNYSGSNSSTLTQTVNKASTSTAISSSANPSGFGSSATFTATVTPSAATGTVTFKDGSTTLGTGTLSGGRATYTTSTLTIGSHSITAAYGGDSNDNSSTSSTLTQKVEQASSVALSSSTNPAPSGGPVTFTAVVTPSAATGTVTFMDGSTSLGTGTLSSGVAGLTTSGLVVGSHPITAVYGGNSTYAGSTSPVLSESILTLTSISIGPQNVSVPVGATQQFTATGTFSNGTNGNITSSLAWTSSATTVATISSAGLATGLDEGPTTIQAALGTLNSSTTLTGTPSRFRFTGSMINARDTFTATTLQNGKVLIAGGTGDGTSLVAQGELYDPTTGTFTKTGNLYTPRFNHTATRLNNGLVLIAGGQVAVGDGTFTETANAELYDPNAGTFSPTSSMNQARKLHTATLLPSGLVLITGGNGLSGDPAQAELYDPTANTFSYTGSLNTARDGHTATLLNDGTVLIAGGETYPGGTGLASAELYDPTAGLFSATGSLNLASSGHAAVLLSSGKVLIGAGYGISAPLARTEVYDPAAKTFTLSGSLTTARSLFKAILLSNGQVLFVGGVGTTQVIGTGELYDPNSGTTSVAGNLNVPRGYHSIAPVNNGLILIAGGIDAGGLNLSNCETYQSTPTEPPPPSLQITPGAANVIIGGTQQFTAVDNLGYPRFDVTWTVSDPTIATVTTNDDNAAIVTGVAAGQVTLVANAEGVSAQEQITILSQSSYTPGTLIWSAPPPVSGFSAQQVAQAVPTMHGPDLYSISMSADGTQSLIQALKADGEQMFQLNMPPTLNNAIPDAGGGLIVTTCASGSPLTVTDLDATGQPVWQVQSALVSGYGYICYAPQIAVRGDGVTFIAEPTNAGLPSITTAYPSGYISSSQFPPSMVTLNGRTTNVTCCVGPPIVNTDGGLYVEYEVRNTNNNVITSDTLYLETPGGPIVLSSTTQDQALLPGPIIPDGNGGVIATWTVSPSHSVLPFPYQAADVTNYVVGTPYNLPFSPQSVTPFQSPNLVLGENGTAFASGSTTATVNGAQVSVDQIASFNLSSGAPNWTYQASQGLHLSIIEATAGNGLAAKSTDASGVDTVLLFDSSGGQSPAMRRFLRSAWRSMRQNQPALSGFSSIDYYSNGWWAGTGNGSAVAILGSMIQSAMSSFGHLQGNHSKQSSAAHVIANFEPVDPVDNPNPSQTAGAFPQRYGNTTISVGGTSVSINQLTLPSFSAYADASFSNYVNQIFKPIDAVAFIGHSFELLVNGTKGAWGICFGQQGTYIDPVSGNGFPSFPCYGPTYTGSILYNNSYYELFAPMPSLGGSQAKIIFWASCQLGPDMQSFMGITNSTPGRALLFPPSATDIDLDMGEFEWLQIVGNLAKGQNLKDAVSNANAATANQTWYAMINGVKTQVPAQAWQVIGDSGNGGTGIHF
jgi:Bacterial Ig-like domain (group 3)/Bacterial Ig-like domain (group 2)/Galactose oxidase, central domain